MGPIWASLSVKGALDLMNRQGIHFQCSWECIFRPIDATKTKITKGKINKSHKARHYITSKTWKFYLQFKSVTCNIFLKEKT